MSDRLRCAIIGTGTAGVELLQGFHHYPKATVVAISEKNAQRAREISERFKISRSYADYMELIEQPDVDAVALAVPTHQQCQIAIEALKARKHVLLERPMALNAKEAAKIIQTAQSMKRIAMVGQELRFHRQVQMARGVMQRGDLGDVYHCHAFWMRRSQVPRIGSWQTQRQYSGGGCVADLGQNLLDLSLHLLGEFAVASVAATFSSKFRPRDPAAFAAATKMEAAPPGIYDVEDYAAVLVRLKSGRALTLHTSWTGHLSPDVRDLGVDFMGTNAGLSVFPARLCRPGAHGFDCSWLQGSKFPHSEDRVHHFVQCILESKKPMVTLEESLAVQQTLDAIFAAGASGKEVALKPSAK